MHCKEYYFVNRYNKEHIISYQNCYKLHSDAEIIINTSPVGMYPNINNSPIELSYFKNCKAVVDIIYNPEKTRLYLQAEELNIPAVTGLEMLVAQAKYAAELFTGNKIDNSVIQDICKNFKQNFLQS